MQPVILVISTHLGGFSRVEQHLIKVNDGIQLTAPSYPLIHRLPYRLVEIRPIVRLSHLGYSASYYFQPTLMRTADEVLIGTDELLCRQLGVLAVSYVVDTFIDHDTRQTTLAHHVTFKSLDRRFTQSTLQHAVAANAQIQDAHLAPQLLRTNVGPAVLQVGRRAASVGNAITQAGPTVTPFGLDVDSRYIVPVFQPLGHVECLVWLALTLHDIRSSSRATMTRSRLRCGAIADGDSQSL